MGNDFRPNFKGKNGKAGTKPQEDGPFNIKAERVVLGTCLVHNKQFERIADKLRTLHFGDALHAQAWAAMGSLVGKGQRADASSIIPQINADAPLADVSALDYLEKLKLESLKLPAEVDSYADAVLSAYRGRELRDLFSTYEARAKSGADDRLLADLHEGLNRIAGDNRPDTYGHVSDGVDGVMRAIRARKERGGSLSGIPTGFPKLDEIIDGLAPATLTLIGARPKQGKTAILLCIMRNLCKRGIKCVFFSLEMPKDQIIQRLIAMESGVDYQRFVRGRYDERESDSLEDASEEVYRWPLIIDDATNLTASGLGLRARNAVFVDGCQAVFIDYMQRISPEKGSKRYEEVTQISMAIADLRKVLNVPIVCAAQLNRKLADRADKVDFAKFRPESTRPTDGDLRDSGQLEQDADTLIFLNRPIVALETMKPVDDTAREIDWETVCQKWRHKAELIVHYNRRGRSGVVDFRFSGPVMRFDEAL